ncbi:MAG: 23S rRNA (pseudouridine(1915)-N(3))-methyltransferase RlmH [Bacteroidales bacterium]|jgi:23S rRNA (pseudouridine1915-N3)-methyltransferase|nr:23S rRNA (pseudouridine(1915)-N(3))-methyltransferase RlmH [Bacteroidales bacterium]NPV35422.1 23S rRNA (pseudouridine(1915)-N(3))-methyltransferase RlmH [Bacteroidales bacterium]
MKITFLLNGKTEEDYIENGLRSYEKRIMRYVPYQRIEIPSPRFQTGVKENFVKEAEARLMEKYFPTGSELILLDEKGKMMSSTEFATLLQQKMNSGIKNLLFVVGGPYGFHENIIKQSTLRLSLSPMTFPHQLVRLIFAEQLYRAFTILRNEPYHHE